MKIIYSCYWGGYLAVVAASLHLGIINGKHLSLEKILNLPLFGKLKKDDFGEMKFVGVDKFKREVFVLGAKSSGQIIQRMLNGLAQIYGMEKKAVEFIDLKGCNNLYIISGLFLIHKLGLRRIGTKMVLCGIKKSFSKIKETVEKSFNESFCFQEK